MNAKVYYTVVIRPFSGGEHAVVFLDHSAALRCMARYAELANKHKESVGNAIIKAGDESVSFSWDSPIGYIHWSVTLFRQSSDDHLYPAKDHAS
jgi:ferric iron reductase protein FhuF